MEFLSCLFQSTFSQVFKNCMPQVWVIVTLSPNSSQIPFSSLFCVPFSSSTHQMPLYGAWSHGCVTLHWNMVDLPLAAVLKKVGSCPPAASSCQAHPPLGRDFLATSSLRAGFALAWGYMGLVHAVTTIMSSYAQLPCPFIWEVFLMKY